MTHQQLTLIEQSAKACMMGTNYKTGSHYDYESLSFAKGSEGENIKYNQKMKSNTDMSEN